MRRDTNEKRRRGKERRERLKEKPERSESWSRTTHRLESSDHSRFIKHVTRNRSQDHGECKQIYMYIHIYKYQQTNMCSHTNTCSFHDVYCSKPLTFHNGSCFFASRCCFKHFCRFQVLTVQTDRKENVNNKIRTHVQCVVHDQEGQRKVNPLKKKACDCYFHLILIDRQSQGNIVQVPFNKFLHPEWLLPLRLLFPGALVPLGVGGSEGGAAFGVGFSRS